MECKDNATRLRREVLIRLVRAFGSGRFTETVDRIPYEMRPKEAAVSRCCLYKDRAILRYRCMAAMGVGVEQEEDDATRLAEYATQALARESLEGPILTVLEIACQGCVASRYLVTDACQRCVARPCEGNCAFGAIAIDERRARIDPAKCRNCGKCAKVCPFHAITRVPVPCEEACPVGAIRKNGGGKARIDFAKCINCGRCMRACPFGAVMEKSQVVDVLRVLKQPRPVVAMVAPSIAGQFPGTFEQIAAGLQRLGFTRVVEVAVGADITARREAAELVERLDGGAAFMTTSCCPAYRDLVQKHLPALEPYVSHTATPLHYTAAWIKEEQPEAVTVFIGPCVAKRREGLDEPEVDYVLTFEEVGAMFVAADLELATLEGHALETPAEAGGRGFAVSGGVAEAVRNAAGNGLAVKPVCINGLDRKAIKMLEQFARSGACPGNLVEVMACEGGCVGGAGTVGNVRVTSLAVAKWSAEAAKETDVTRSDRACGPDARARGCNRGGRDGPG